MLPTIEVTLSKQAMAVLKGLARYGIYGQSVEEVAVRLIDRGLEQYVERPVFVDEKKEG